MRISGVTYVPRKTHKIRNFFVVALVLILVLFIAVAAVSAYVSWDLTHPKKAEIPPFESNIIPEYKDASFTDIHKSVNLSGWFFSAQGSDKTIILAHGYGRNRLQFDIKTLDMIKSFLNKGYNVLTFDFRNSGRSGGKKSTLGLYEKDDLLGAVNFAKAQGSKHIVLLGFSTGASTCILAAAESRDIEAVIADSPFSDLKKYLNESLQTWTRLPEFPFNRTVDLSLRYLTNVNSSNISPVKVIGKLSPEPVLFIHSKDDKSISLSNSRELYDAYSKIAGDKAELWETAGAGHAAGYEMYPEDYMDRVIGFLDKIYKSRQ